MDENKIEASEETVEETKEETTGGGE